MDYSIALAVLLVVALLYQKYLDLTRDVPPEYLNEQSIVDTIRNPNELAIYKSTKLDYSTGLRVGLAIRYNHYKLRNGNLCDVWELMMQQPEKNIYICRQVVKVAELNHQVHQLSQYLKGESEVGIPLSSFITNPAVLAVVVACFVSRITVHLYEDEKDQPTLSFIYDRFEGRNAIVPFVNVVSLGESAKFSNVYDFEKDRGIAVRLSTRLNHRVTAQTDFTQSNLVSSVASCIKHLPPGQEIKPSDRFLVVQNYANAESIMNGLVKALVAFVTHAELHLDVESTQYMDCCPTIVSAHELEIAKWETHQLGVEKILLYHRLFSLSRLRFSLATTNVAYPSLRLVYAHRSINTRREGASANVFRAAFCSHFIEELGYHNAAGPLLVSDLHDYRPMPAVSGRGCVCQADEFKIINYDGIGDVCVRGYNIGKSTTTMSGVGDKIIRPDAEGFFQLAGVRARWGNDGCLYISS